MGKIERRSIEKRDILRTYDTARDVIRVATIEPTLTNPDLAMHIENAHTTLPDAVREAAQPPAAGIAVIENFTHHDPVEFDQYVGPSPEDWQQGMYWTGSANHYRKYPGLLERKVAMILLARCAGAPFAWEGQQSGQIVNDVVPTRGKEHEQSGASSSQLLTPHTEDPFHPDRSNLLMLGGMRNPYQVQTTTASITAALDHLSGEDRDVLSQTSVIITPDVTYTTNETVQPQRVFTLADQDGRTFLRYDPEYTDFTDCDPEFIRAYDRLGRALGRVSVGVAAQPADLLLIDNDTNVHGRAAYTATYGPWKRWIQRTNIHIPTRQRPPYESHEHGYGQRIIAPFAN